MHSIHQMNKQSIEESKSKFDWFYPPNQNTFVKWTYLVWIHVVSGIRFHTFRKEFIETTWKYSISNIFPFILSPVFQGNLLFLYFEKKTHFIVEDGWMLKGTLCSLRHIEWKRPTKRTSLNSSLIMALMKFTRHVETVIWIFLTDRIIRLWFKSMC